MLKVKTSTSALVAAPLGPADPSTASSSKGSFCLGFGSSAAATEAETPAPLSGKDLEVESKRKGLLRGRKRVDLWVKWGLIEKDVVGGENEAMVMDIDLFFQFFVF